jgi:hypothetical protein
MATDRGPEAGTALDALADLVDKLHLVLHHDWEFTKDALNANPGTYTIAPGATFLEPGVEDESNNWGNRGSLLAAYRRALMVLRAHGREPSL